MQVKMIDEVYDTDTPITASNPGLITPSKEEASCPATERYHTSFHFVQNYTQRKRV